MLRSSSFPRPRRRTLVAAGVGLLAAAAALPAQTHWTIDPKTSLAWWQVSPHLNHLWATTCPQEPSWRPGEGRSSGWKAEVDVPGGTGNVDDTVDVPIHPRHKVRSVCRDAVAGAVHLPDSVRWRGARGQVTVRADALLMGEAMRDVMMHQVLETAQFPEIQFSLDSLVQVTRQADTLVASAVGTLTVHGRSMTIAAPLKAFPDGGGMRVLAKWRMPAWALNDLTPRLKSLGLGVSTNIWHFFFMGADLVFRPEGAAAN